MTTTLEAIPDHVPADLVRDIDIYNIQALHETLHLGWKRVQDENPPIFFTPKNGGHWIFTRAELIKRLFEDSETFISEGAYVPPMPPGAPKMLPINSDGSEHKQFRAFVTPFLIASKLSASIQRARELAIKLIEDLQPRGGCDFQRDFAEHLPIQIFLDMVDLPLSDRPRLLEFAAIVRMQDDEERETARAALFAYLAEKIQERIANPGEDMISKIVTGQVDGRPVTFEEMLGECTVVLLGGLDTVASMMGFIANFLANSPEVRHRIASEPKKIPRIIDELMRRFGVAAPNRRAAHDVEIDGVLIKAGDTIHISSCLHGLDEKRWENSLVVDLDRPVRDPMTFGGNGPHRCPGAALARAEIAIFLEEWLARIPDFRIKPGATPTYGSGSVNGVLSLPLEWDVQPVERAA